MYPVPFNIQMHNHSLNNSSCQDPSYSSTTRKRPSPFPSSSPQAISIPGGVSMSVMSSRIPDHANYPIPNHSNYPIPDHANYPIPDHANYPKPDQANYPLTSQRHHHFKNDIQSKILANCQFLKNTSIDQQRKVDNVSSVGILDDEDDQQTASSDHLSGIKNVQSSELNNQLQNDLSDVYIVSYAADSVLAKSISDDNQTNDSNFLDLSDHRPNLMKPPNDLDISVSQNIVIDGCLCSNKIEASNDGQENSSKLFCDDLSGQSNIHDPEESKLTDREMSTTVESANSIETLIPFREINAPASRDGANNIVSSSHDFSEYQQPNVDSNSLTNDKKDSNDETENKKDCQHETSLSTTFENLAAEDLKLDLLHTSNDDHRSVMKFYDLSNQTSTVANSQIETSTVNQIDNTLNVTNIDSPVRKRKQILVARENIDIEVTCDEKSSTRDLLNPKSPNSKKRIKHSKEFSKVSKRKHLKRRRENILRNKNQTILYKKALQKVKSAPRCGTKIKFDSSTFSIKTRRSRWSKEIAKNAITDTSTTSANKKSYQNRSEKYNESVNVKTEVNKKSKRSPKQLANPKSDSNKTQVKSSIIMNHKSVSIENNSRISPRKTKPIQNVIEKQLTFFDESSKNEGEKGTTSDFCDKLLQYGDKVPDSTPEDKMCINKSEILSSEQNPNGDELVEKRYEIIPQFKWNEGYNDGVVMDTVDDSLIDINDYDDREFLPSHLDNDDCNDVCESINPSQDTNTSNNVDNMYGGQEILPKLNSQSVTVKANKSLQCQRRVGKFLSDGQISKSNVSQYSLVDSVPPASDPTRRKKYLDKVASGPLLRIKSSDSTQVSIVNEVSTDVIPTVSSKVPSQKLPQMSLNMSALPENVSTLTEGACNSNDTVWYCAICRKHSSFRFLGDLFGPYYRDGYQPKTNGRQINKRNVCSFVLPEQLTDEWYRPKHSKRLSGSSDKYLETWVHEACVLWSHGVYLISGHLYGLHEASSVSSITKCTICNEVGASIGCLFKGCRLKFHYVCAIDSGCYLNEINFSLLCLKHKDKRSKKS